jgi:hypothetical protein
MVLPLSLSMVTMRQIFHLNFSSNHFPTPTRQMKLEPIPGIHQNPAPKKRFLEDVGGGSKTQKLSIFVNHNFISWSMPLLDVFGWF